MSIDAHVAYVELKENGSGTLHLCDRVPNGSRGQSRLHFDTAPYEVISQTLDQSKPMLAAQVAGLPSHGEFLAQNCPAPPPESVAAPFKTVA